MRIRVCNLENFRNIAAERLRFEGNRVFLHGLNAQGKSNLLEALGLLHAVRSFRTADLRPLVRQGASLARAYYEMDDAGQGAGTVLLELRKAGGREVHVNEARCPTLGDFLARFPCMVLAADDVTVIRGAPAGRRRLLDLHFSSSRPGYYASLRDYYRGLAARNRLLKHGAAAEQLRAHDRPLAEAGARVSLHRREGTEALAPVFREVFNRISGGGDDPGLELRPAAESREAAVLLDAWQRSLERDRLLGATQIGPHRDDWLFRTGGGNAREFASDGQQRNLAIALKLALFQDLRERSTTDPVLLADDVLGELDLQRREAFWRCLPENCQIFATGTSFEADRHPGAWEVFRVTDGRFKPDC